MFREKRLVPLVLGMALLAPGCGGSTEGAAPLQMLPATRGQLLNSPPAKLGSFSVSDLLSRLSGSQMGRELIKLAFSPTCSVDSYHLEYDTVGARGEATTASAALMIPTGSHPRCQGPRPIVLYAHGKRTLKSFNIADLTSQSNEEGLALATVGPARGYIVVAPNYAGYDTSSLDYHPYLNADQQSKDMIDALTAAHSALSALNIADNHKLFVTGYSQGGHVAMATHRALQAAGIAVTASAPMSGPYAMSAFGDAVMMGQVDDGSTVNFIMLASSYQHAYGNLYTTPTDILEPKYASAIDALSTTDANTLIAQGLLPSHALFDSKPPAPEFASMTPATQPADLAPVFAMGFGAEHLVSNAYRLSYLRDAQAAPDGGFPIKTTGVPPVSPANTLRQDLKTNDLRNWSPTAPVLLCGGDADPSVFFLNTQLIQQYWATNTPSGRVTVLDVDSSGGPYADIKDAFRAAKDLIALDAIAHGATDGGAAAVREIYHATLVPPFCLMAVTSFFDAH
jgi:esterase/lipase